jgi:hypothetical protein
MPTVRFRPSYAALMLLALVPFAAQAQEATPPADSTGPYADSLLSVLRSAEQRNLYLRFTTRSQSTYAGYVFQVEPDSGWTHVGARRAMLPAITRVELRHKDQNGALLGSIVGAAVLAYAGLELNVDCMRLNEDTRRMETYTCDAGWPLGIAGFLAGGLLGAIAGVAVDPGVTTWEEVWRETGQDE